LNASASSFSDRLIELDFARGIAILLAIGWHFHIETGIFALDALQIPAITIGWAGVDLFFVLSGFLIGSLIFAEIRRTGSFDARRFLIRRAFKIWPVLYLYIALLLLTGRYEPMQIVPQTLFHMQNYWLTPLNHLWSLAVEEHFYLTFALLAAIFSLSVSSVERVPLVLLSIMAAALVARLAGAALAIEPTTIQVQTHFRIDSLACGVLLAYVKFYKPDFFASLLGKKALWVLLVILGIAFLILADWLIPTLGYTVAYIAAAAFLLLLMESRIMLSKLRPVRLIAWIGTYSYAMYVFQFVMYRALERGWHKASLGAIPPTIELTMKYGGAIITAVIVSKSIERPLLLLRNQLFPSPAIVRNRVNGNESQAYPQTATGISSGSEHTAANTGMEEPAP